MSSASHIKATFKAIFEKAKFFLCNVDFFYLLYQAQGFSRYMISNVDVGGLLVKNLKGLLKISDFLPDSRYLIVQEHHLLIDCGFELFLFSGYAVDCLSQKSFWLLSAVGR